MKWHCTAPGCSGFKYCSGEPEWEREPDGLKNRGEGEVRMLSGGICKLNPETCGKCQSLLEQTDLTVPWLNKPTYIENIIPIEKPKDKEGKPMSKKAKKLEAELMQGSMF